MFTGWRLWKKALEISGFDFFGRASFGMVVEYDGFSRMGVF